MAKFVVMPKIGWVMQKGKIVEWLKKEGEEVKKGEPLFVVETEKVTQEVEAQDSGILRKIIASEGAEASPAENLAILASPGEEVDIDVVIASIKPTPPPPTVPLAEKVEEVKLLITPAARRLAKEHMVDITKLRGTGPGGRIVVEDILKAVEEAKAVQVARRPPRVAKVIPLTGIRKITAERMSHSFHTAARAELTVEVDMTESVRLREEKGKEGIHISYTDIVVKATAQALKEHPIMNSTLDDDQIKIFEDINIGVAVDIEDGLIVPVVPDADKKSLADISSCVNELIQKARLRKLSLDEISGGTFTITNLGMFGVESFTPIINPPEAGILGVGKIGKKPVVVDDQVVVRPIMLITLSFDHRVVDGAPAAQFLQRLKQLLESPGQLDN